MGARISVCLALLFALETVGACTSSSSTSTAPAGESPVSQSNPPGAEGGDDAGTGGGGGGGGGAAALPDAGSAAEDAGVPTGIDAAPLLPEAGVFEAGTMMTVKVTFYGWDDNDPPGDSISYPESGGFPTIHDSAGGSGTIDDPITFATDPGEFAPGTILYVPFIEKYVVMEDDCEQCMTDWAAGQWHIDIWMNSDGTEDPSMLTACAQQWTLDATQVEVSPPPGEPTTTNPLFDPTTNSCRSTP